MVPGTVAEIVAAAGVSRRTFYEIFEGRDHCVLAAVDDALGRARERILPAYEAPTQWQDAMREGLRAALGFLDEEPAAGLLLVVGTQTAGRAVSRRRQRVLAGLADAVDEGRAAAPNSWGISRTHAEGVVGALLGVLHTRLHERRGTPVSGLLGALMGMVIMPYLGPEAAAREAARRHHLPRARLPARDRADPLRGLDIRMTVRTVAVISAIAAHPGGSNRQVAELSGVHDQGQMSKLLARLSKAGLIENRSQRVCAGEANAWRLTGLGRELERTIVRDGGAPAMLRREA